MQWPPKTQPRHLGTLSYILNSTLFSGVLLIHAFLVATPTGLFSSLWITCTCTWSWNCP